MSKILLLGGTGAIGVYLRDILSAGGHDVFVTSRRNQSPTAGIEFIQGDAHNLNFMSLVLERVKPDAIVDFMIYGTNEFKNRRDLFLNSTKHYLFLSSYRVFNDDKIITERSPRLLDSSQDMAYLSTDEYALCKARSENLLREAKSSNWTIIRPGITYSTNRFQLGCLEANTLCYRAFLGLPVVMPKEMRGRQTTMTWGGDVARMIARLVLNPSAYGEDFNCATSEHHLWEDICSVYSDLIGTEVRDCSIDDYVRVVGNSAQVRYDRLFDRVLDNSKVLGVTGLKQNELMTLKVGLSKELEALKINKGVWFPDIRINARLDRLLGVSIPLSQFSFLQRCDYYAERSRLAGFLMCGIRKMRRILR